MVSHGSVILTTGESTSIWVFESRKLSCVRCFRNFAAAAKATKEIYGIDPDLTREGGS